MNKTAIIIQARTGSKRLPNKMVMPFFQDKTVLDILISRILKSAKQIPVFLATTTNPNDDILVEIGKKYPIQIYRGSEENVLSRFTDISNTHNLQTIIRVCADNPFFDIKGTLELLKHHHKESDYTSYYLSPNKPSILTHLGFWGEIIQAPALQSIKEHTSNKLYKEHVTNYIYTHQKKYQCRFVAAPTQLFHRSDIRLTLDTKEDFELYQDVYDKLLSKEEYDIIKLINFIDSDKKIKEKMAIQIISNSK